MDGVAVQKPVERSPADPEKARGPLLIAMRRFEDSENAITLQRTERARKIL